MKLLAIAALPSLISLASARCYNGGAPWPDNHAGMVHQIEQTAHHFANLGQLKPGEHVHNVNFEGKCLHFVLDNISGHHMSITKDGAADGFLKEYTGCHNGGDSSYTHWRFVGDPNEEC